MNIKIVCTIGPSSWSEDVLRKMIDAGMNIARINASFADHNEIKRVKDLIKYINPNIKVLLDLMGNKIRITKLEENRTINDGQEVVINCNQNELQVNELTVTYSDLCNDIKVDAPILIDDGKIKLIVRRIEGSRIFCEVIKGGIVKKGKTVNVPNTHLSFDSLTDKDVSDLKFGVEQNFDYIAASFVRSANDIEFVKSYITNSNTKVIAKIENPEGVENFDAILEISDGIMVARGDLGVEMALEQIPILQKRFIKKANWSNKFVIVATQMLESMVENSSPTRAEVSDVANAVIDGASAVMLSAETSTGKHPVEAIQYMNTIITYIQRVWNES